MNVKDKKNIHTRKGAQVYPQVLPYPQTPDSAKEALKKNGISVAGLARDYQLPRRTLSELINGRHKGDYGLAHKGAVLLGLKPKPQLVLSKPQQEAA